MELSDYIVKCWNCRADFDAADAMWCACSPATPTKTCPFCLACFCSATSDYSEMFWRDAPGDLNADRALLPQRRAPLGRMLVADHRITVAQLDEALRHQAGTGHQLGRCLLDLGFLDAEDLNRYLGSHHAPMALALDDAVIDDAMARALGHAYCAAHRVVPVERIELGGHSLIMLAMSNPADVAAIEHATEVLHCRVVPASADEDQIDSLLRVLFPAEQQLAEIAGGRPAASDTDVAERLVVEAASNRVTHLRLIERAARVDLQWAVDGSMHTVPSAGGDTGQHALDALLAWFAAGPDGRARRFTVDDVVFVAVLHLKTIATGRIATVHLFDPREVDRDMHFAALSAESRFVLERTLAGPAGLVILTGPAPAGTEDSFWALLNEVAAHRRETVLLGAPHQHPAAHVRDGSEALHGALHTASAESLGSNPVVEVLALYRCTDRQDLQRAVAEAARRLVVLRITASGAETAIKRLLDAGVCRDTLSLNLLLVVDQRAVRRICERCFELDPDGRAALVEAGFSRAESLGTETYRGAGCTACGVATGYRGREPLIELVPAQAAIARAISTDLDDHSVWSSQALLTPPLRAQGLDLVRRGVTTVAEVIRVVNRPIPTAHDRGAVHRPAQNASRGL